MYLASFKFMSRYISCYVVTTALEELPSLVETILTTCGFEIIYQRVEYIMAREIPGRVSFNKLVTVEVLIDSTKATTTQVQVDIIVKNDELPLQVNNHCRQLFNKIAETITQSPQWHLLESAIN